MEINPSEPGRAPAGSFQLEELEAFQALEGQALADVNYYLWLNQGEPGATPYRFLFYLELVFDNSATLLLTGGEDSAEIRVGSAESLVKTAKSLHKLHDRISIQRVNAGNFPLWQNAVGRPLAGVRLSRNEAGLYTNDALLLDFGQPRILVHLGEKEGLQLTPYGA